MDLTPGLVEDCKVLVYNDGVVEEVCDPLVVESQLSIYLNGKEFIRMACSPHAYKELAVGYLVSEGLIKKLSDIKEIDSWDGVVKIEREAGESRAALNEARFINTCSGMNLNDIHDFAGEAGSDQKFSARMLLKLIGELDDQSHTFKRTGGVHSAALGTEKGLLVRYEDIGRHNAVDKVLGYAFLNGIDFSDKCLALSGRIASEILMKAVRSRVPLILSRSAPMLRTVELAQQLGITIIGFARGKRFNVYCHSSRIMFD